MVASVQSALEWATQIMPAATTLSQSALNSAQVLGSSVMPAFSMAFLLAPDPVDAMDVHGRGDPFAGRLHHRQQFRRHDLVPAFRGGELVEIGGHAGLVPLGDFRALELHGGRRVAGDHVGAELGQRVGGVAGDRGLLPFAAAGGEHLAELGDRLRVGAGGPLVQQLVFGSAKRPPRQGCTPSLRQTPPRMIPIASLPFSHMAIRAGSRMARAAETFFSAPGFSRLAHQRCQRAGTPARGAC